VDLSHLHIVKVGELELFEAELSHVGNDERAIVVVLEDVTFPPVFDFLDE
jgi:hypothetical protein